MAYEPTVWKSGDIVSSEKLNKLENGVAAAAESGGSGGSLKNFKDVSGTYTVFDDQGDQYQATFTSAIIENDVENNTASNPYAHAEGTGTTASGYASHAEGTGTMASGYASHAEGTGTMASGIHSHAEGQFVIASGDWSHAEGAVSDFRTQTINNVTYTKSGAYGNLSHSEGRGNLAIGQASHAEGYNTVASGNYSHAEGNSTTASGNNSHTEGYNTVASGFTAHAEGYYTEAKGDHSHVSGKYNIADTSGNYAFIIGNGTDNNQRSNAFAIKWDGTLVFANGTEITPTQFTSLLALLNN